MSTSQRHRNPVKRNQRIDLAIKLSFLDELASIVGEIDYNKNVGGKNIIALTDKGMKLITNMEQKPLDIGGLYSLFASLQILHNNHDILPELIDKTHCEIERLLGDEAWIIYAPN